MNSPSSQPNREKLKKEFLRRFKKDTYALTKPLEKQLDADADWWLDKISQALAEQREVIMKNIIEIFRERCVVNIDGDCKYFDREKLGYSQDDDTFWCDKFFPQHKFLDPIIASITDQKP